MQSGMGIGKGLGRLPVCGVPGFLGLVWIEMDGSRWKRWSEYPHGGICARVDVKLISYWLIYVLYVMIYDCSVNMSALYEVRDIAVVSALLASPVVISRVAILVYFSVF